MCDCGGGTTERALLLRIAETLDLLVELVEERCPTNRVVTIESFELDFSQARNATAPKAKPEK